MRYVSADIADKGVKSRQKKRIAKPPKPIKMGAPEYNDKIIIEIKIHIKKIDSWIGST